MSMPIAPSAEEAAADRAAYEQLITTVCASSPMIWIVEEQYDTNGPLWRVTLVCQGDQARWMRRRYRYDIPSGTLHFAGEQPLSDAELAAARRSGRRI